MFLFHVLFQTRDEPFKDSWLTVEEDIGNYVFFALEPLLDDGVFVAVNILNKPMDISHRSKYVSCRLRNILL
jgi:hypothetical protein